MSSSISRTAACLTFLKPLGQNTLLPIRHPRSFTLVFMSIENTPYISMSLLRQIAPDERGGMDPSDCSIHALSSKRRAHSASSRVSHAGTFHSFSTTLHDSDSDSGIIVLNESVTATRNRTGSGFSGSAVPKSYMSRSAKTVDPAFEAIENLCSSRSTSAETLTQSKQRPQSRGYQETRKRLASSSLQELEGSKPIGRRGSIEVRRYSSMTPGSWQSSRRSSFNPGSAPVILYGRPRTLSRASSVYATTKQEDPYVVHQRAIDIFQPTKTVRQSPSPRLPSPTYSSNADQSSLTGIKSQSKLMDTSGLHTGTSLSNEEASNQIPSFAPATVIDWTDPSTRRKQYEQHDRSRRGFRGLWRKLTPKWFQGSGSRVSFYDGDSDAGSVRRYRLDLGDDGYEKGSKLKAISKDKEEVALYEGNEKELRPKLRREGSGWSCFSNSKEGGGGEGE